MTLEKLSWYSKVERRKIISENFKVLPVRKDDMFNDLFGEDNMNTIEWVVMQILNCKYEDIHGKVIVRNTKLSRMNKKERRKIVDLLVNYNNCDINIELNNNFDGQYIRNYLYAFILILNKYLRLNKEDKSYYNKLYKVISVNLNWYKTKELGKKMPPKREIVLPCNDANNDYLLKIIMVNLDYYSGICYNDVAKEERLYKLLTIDNKKELDRIIQDEELLKEYGSKVLELSKNGDGNMEWKEEYDEIISRFENYQAGKIDKEREMIIGMNENHVSPETIAKIAKISLEQVKEILKEETAAVK